MSNPSKPAWPARLGAAGLLVVAGQALAGVTPVESRAAPRSAAYPLDTRAPAVYVLRCWQMGRLLFEEPLQALPVDPAGHVVKAAGTDRQGRPVYVADTRNATCLVKAWGADPAR